MEAGQAAFGSSLKCAVYLKAQIHRVLNVYPGIKCTIRIIGYSCCGLLSINLSKRIYIAPHQGLNSEAQVGWALYLNCCGLFLINQSINQKNLYSAHSRSLLRGTSGLSSVPSLIAVIALVCYRGSGNHCAVFNLSKNRVRGKRSVARTLRVVVFFLFSLWSSFVLLLHFTSSENTTQFISSHGFISCLLTYLWFTCEAQIAAAILRRRAFRSRLLRFSSFDSS